MNHDVDIATGTPEPQPPLPGMNWSGQNGPVWVYAHIGDQDSVLYIGASSQPSERLKQHRRRSEWYPEIKEVRYFGPFANWDAARVEERLIRKHLPAFNRQMRQRIPFQPADLPSAQRTAAGGAS